MANSIDMKIKEFDCDAPTAVREKRSEFRFQTRCITALAERYYEPRRDTETQWKIMVEALSVVEPENVRELYNMFSIGLHYDINSFFVLKDEEKKKATLAFLHTGLIRLCEKYNWSTEPFERACDKVVELNYKNEWVWKKPKTSPDRKYTAEIFCIHEVESFSIYMIIRDRKTKNLLMQELLTSTKPDELIFKPCLGELKWLSNTRVKLFDQIDEQSWTVKL